jgi:hypothetical protein
MKSETVPPVKERSRIQPSATFKKHKLPAMQMPAQDQVEPVPGSGGRWMVRAQNLT